MNLDLLCLDQHPAIRLFDYLRGPHFWIVYEVSRASAAPTGRLLIGI